MGRVPFEIIHVPLFQRTAVKYLDQPKCKVFMVKSTLDPHVKVKLWWTKGGYEELKKRYENISDYDEINLHGGFVNGRPLINLSVPVFTCAGLDRSRVFYRVVHDQQPHYGMKARGYGLVKVTPLLFQVLVDKHLNWRCRHHSPFMSVTNCHTKIRQIIRILQKRGKTGLRVITFRSDGEGWDHKTQRLFHVPVLGRYLHSIDYEYCTYMQAEYLLESHIPPESILKIAHIKDVNHPPKQKKRKLEEDDSSQEKKKRVSTKRSTDFRRER
ncbi:hypothetical protein F4678DRAFT_463261 [Xylaria arbuscula]|nr:hypothetical protein F4678DRAFT_463261 [Xylaria arbuscula]